MKQFIEVTVLNPINVSTYPEEYEEIRTLLNTRAILEVHADKRYTGCFVSIVEASEPVYVKETYTEVRAKIMEACL